MILILDRQISFTIGLILRNNLNMDLLLGKISLSFSDKIYRACGIGAGHYFLELPFIIWEASNMNQ